MFCSHMGHIGKHHPLSCSIKFLVSGHCIWREKKWMKVNICVLNFECATSWCLVLPFNLFSVILSTKCPLLVVLCLSWLSHSPSGLNASNEVANYCLKVWWRGPLPTSWHTYTLSSSQGCPGPPANCKTAILLTLYWWDSRVFYWLAISLQLFEELFCYSCSHTGWLTFPK